MFDRGFPVRVISLATVIALLLSHPAGIQAQSDGAMPQEAPAPDSHFDEEARQVYLAGVAAYDAGRYEAALEYFSRAHALSGRPLLLFNIGSVTERLRRDDESLAAYEAYLEAVPDAPNRAFVESRIVFLREQLNERWRREEAARHALEEASEVSPAEPAEPTNPAEPAEIADLRVTEPERSAPLRLEMGPAEAPRDITDEWWFWTLMGIGIVAAGVGVGAAVAAADSGDAAPVAADFGSGSAVVALVAVGEW